MINFHDHGSNIEKKITGETYTMSISIVKSGDINNSYFTTDGFKISDITEGLNCGVVEEER